LDKADKNKIPLVAVFPYTDKKLKNNYIGIYTVCLPLNFLESKNISFKSKN